MNVLLAHDLLAAMVAVLAIQALGKKELGYRSLQSHLGEEKAIGKPQNGSGLHWGVGVLLAGLPAA